MKLVSLKVRAMKIGTAEVTESEIFFQPAQLTLIKPNQAIENVSMVKIAGEYFAVDGIPSEVYEQIKLW
jgi:hypothetical protein